MADRIVTIFFERAERGDDPREYWRWMRETLLGGSRAKRLWVDIHVSTSAGGDASALLARFLDSVRVVD
jgi:hypothetical protein